MYLEEQNSDLNDEINDLICLSNDLTILEDRLAVKLKGWNLIPESKINFVALLIAIHQIKSRIIAAVHKGTGSQTNNPTFILR